MRGRLPTSRRTYRSEFFSPAHVRLRQAGSLFRLGSHRKAARLAVKLKRPVLALGSPPGSISADPEKKDVLRAPVLASRGMARGGHRLRSGVPPPPAEQAPAGVSANGRSPFCGSVRVRRSRERKSEVLHPDVTGGFFCSVSFARLNPERNRGRLPTVDLIQRLRSTGELVDPVKRAILDVREFL